MVGISSKAAGTLENKKQKFQGQELDDDLGINWYGFKWRNHDPQIGRFIEIDPLSNDYVNNSTYAFAENKVINHFELEGLEGVPVNGGNPLAYVAEGFRQMFQAVGDLFSFKAEVHVNKEVEVKSEVKTPVGSIENKTTTTVVENKAEIKTNFGEYFKNGGGKMVEVSASSNAMSKIENTTTATVKTSGAPLKSSSKTTVDGSGTSQTVTVGTGATVDIGNKGKGGIAASLFTTQQQTGTNEGKSTFGFKVSGDATFVNKSIPTINTSGFKVTTNIQTTVGGSVTKTYKLPNR